MGSDIPWVPHTVREVLNHTELSLEAFMMWVYHLLPHKAVLDSAGNSLLHILVMKYGTTAELFENPSYIQSLERKFNWIECISLAASNRFNRFELING